MDTKDDYNVRVGTGEKGIADSCAAQYLVDRGRRNCNGGDYLRGGGGGDSSDREGLGNQKLFRSVSEIFYGVFGS